MYLLNNNKSMRHNRLTPARAATALAQAARRATAALAIILLTATTAGAQDAITGLTYNSAGGYYEISDAQDLVDLANYVNATDNYASTGKTFKQTQDIDMSSISNFKPIGGLGGSYSFAGTYDGGGHTISGLTVSIDYGDIGLFGVVKGATVSNVILLSPTVTATMTKNFSVDLGALIGMCGSGSSNRVENCHVVNPTVSSSSTSSDNYVGAIIGNIWYKNTTATNCYYYGNANAAYGNNPNGATVTNVCAAHLVTPADGVTIQTAMAPALGFTCDTDNNGTAENYWRSGAVLTLGYTGTAPDGYIVSGYTATNGTVGGNANDGYTLTMPNADVTVTATFSTPDPNDFSQSGDTYTIHSAAGWNVFCDLLAQHARGYFSGKTVRLGADITVTRMAGGQPFTGTFDGGGHTLTLDYGTADAPIDAQFVAPFIETAADGDHQPTFSNLTIDGTIYATHTKATDHDHVGGLIGHLFGTVTIEHCTSLVEIHAKGGAGGFVGLCEHSVSFTDCHSAAVVRSAGGSNSGFVAWSRSSYWNINFTGCLFDGKLLQQNGNGDSNGGFIGWKGDAKTVNITNSLCAPAPLADGETMASSNSATFSREHSNYAATITNCYDTAAFETAQGKATRTVTAGTDVTIKAIALTGTATQYTVSGITAYSGGGLQRGETLYYGSDDQLSLTLSNTATGAPQGYRYDGYTASAGTLSGTTLTMPDENVTISVNTAGALRSTRQSVTVAFIKADGTTDEASAIALDGHETVDKWSNVRLAAGTYYVGTDIAYANLIQPDGDVTLILADRKTMTLNGDTDGIRGGYNLTIYGQSLDAATAGTLRYDGTSVGINMSNYVQHSGNVSITTSGFLVEGISADVTLWGGTLTISANGANACAISGRTHSILGGHLTATATGVNAIGIYGYANSGTAITLGWTRPDDRITASSISAPDGGTVAVATGKALTDGSGNIYTGTLDASVLSGFAAKTTLQPCLALADAADNTAAIAAHAGQTLAVALSGRTLYKDGSWNTLCLPFDVTTASGTLSGDNVQAMTLNTTTSNLTDGTLTLNFDAAETIPAGTPFIIKWDEPADYVAYDGQNAATCSDLVNPVFEGVTVSNVRHDATITGLFTFTGTYAPLSFSAGDRSVLILGSDDKLCHPSEADASLGACRAYVTLQPSTPTVDVDGNGLMDTADVTALVSMILGKAEPTEAADVNGSGQTTIADVAKLVDLILDNGSTAVKAVITNVGIAFSSADVTLP